MKIIFAGTPPFAARALEALIEAGHDVCLVLSQPDRPSGRGMKLTPSAVKSVALAHDIAVVTPLTLSLRKAPEEAAAMHDLLRAQNADLMVVAAYGMILPQVVLDIPKGIGPDASVKCINIHASLLPRWRGAAPITRAIEAGDSHFGVTLMKMDAGLDTGPMLAKERFIMAADETTQTLTDKVTALGARMLVQLLQEPDKITTTKQPEEGVTYAHKISKEEGLIDFSQSAAVVERKIRAYTPFPSSYAKHKDTVIKIWQAHIVDMQGTPGEILRADKNGVVIACGQDAICATVLQRPGKPKMPVESFLQGYEITKGDIFQ
ncbi:MAG: methionyl-tRNA formyltransferase [Candidatus Aphodousia sp.]|nr:methionyl-tRNA formyltransferase [Sutterella sp.]MDY2899487.1 methionyl-tRNA formyltransferase [Candidatus Aphodousia sp.]